MNGFDTGKVDNNGRKIFVGDLLHAVTHAMGRRYISLNVVRWLPAEMRIDFGPHIEWEGVEVVGSVNDGNEYREGFVRWVNE